MSRSTCELGIKQRGVTSSFGHQEENNPDARICTALRTREASSCYAFVSTRLQLSRAMGMLIESFSPSHKFSLLLFGLILEGSWLRRLDNLGLT